VSGPEVLAVVVMVGMAWVALQGVVSLFRRHSLDARRPGLLVERMRRHERTELPPRLTALQGEVAQALAGPTGASTALGSHLFELGAMAPVPVDVAPPPTARRGAWLSAQLARLEAAYRISEPAPSTAPPPTASLPARTPWRAGQSRGATPP
jgi:hypothetical protein